MRYPLMVAFAAVAVGAVAAEALSLNPSFAACLAAGAFALLLVALRRQNGIFVAALLCLALLSAWTQTLDAQPMAPPADCGDDQTVWRAEVNDAIDRVFDKRGGMRQRTVLNLLAQQCHEEWLRRSGRVAIELEAKPPVVRGDTIVLRLRLLKSRWQRNPVGADVALMKRQRNVSLWASAISPHVFVSRGHGLGATLDRWRTYYAAAFEANVAAEYAGLAKALTMGDRGGISPEMTSRWAAAGIAHLLSVSGLNVTLVAGLFFWMWSFVLGRIPGAGERFSLRRSAALLTIPAVVVYCLWVGSPSPAVRATIMGVSFLAGTALRLPNAAGNALGASGIALVLCAPVSLHDPSFLLSFCAMVALLWAPQLPKWPSRWGALLRFVAAPAFASLAATLATLPISANFFNRISLVAPISNLPAVPVAMLATTPLAMAFGILALMGPLVTRVSGWVLNVSLAFLDGIARMGSHWPLASIYVMRPNALEVIAYVSALLALLWALRSPRWWYGVALSLTVMTGSICTRYAHRFVSDELTVLMPYVGQGDSTILLLPHGQVVLVDAGGALEPGGWDPGDKVLVPLLRELGVRSIDLAILTHPHPDHFGGFAAVSEQFPIHELWMNGAGLDIPEVANLVAHVAGSGGIVRVAALMPPAVVKAGVSFEILHPRPPGASSERPVYESMSENDNSLCLRVQMGERSLLLTGDLEGAAETLLMPKWRPTDILKAPHHGSDLSSTMPFLSALRPQWVWISVGDHNPFGFPSASTLDRYREIGAQVLRTDLDGLLTARTKGKTWRIDTQRQRLEADNTL
jgi:competence protein ComEC